MISLVVILSLSSFSTINPGTIKTRAEDPTKRWCWTDLTPGVGDIYCDCDDCLYKEANPKEYIISKCTPDE